MKRKIFSALCAFLLTVPAMHAQWVVADPGNLGTIVRSGCAFSVTGIIAGEGGADFRDGAERHVHLQGGLENL